MSATEDRNANGEDIGVFSFAKKSAQLLIPLVIVMSVFGVWVNSRIGEVKDVTATAMELRIREANKLYVSREEFVSFVKLMDERNQRDRKDSEEQLRAIHRNTLFLERIGMKLGIERPKE